MAKGLKYAVGSKWKIDGIKWCTCGRCGLPMKKADLFDHTNTVHFGIKTVEQGAVTSNSNGNGNNGVTPLMVQMIVGETPIGAFAPDEIVAMATHSSRPIQTTTSLETGKAPRVPKAQKPAYQRAPVHQRGLSRR